MKLAKLARDGAVTTATAHRLSEALQIGQSDSHLIRRNALVSQEYNPAVTDAQRLTNACACDDWAIAQAGSWHARHQQQLKNQSNAAGPSPTGL
jgi:hypothetical protein